MFTSAWARYWKKYKTIWNDRRRRRHPSTRGGEGAPVNGRAGQPRSLGTNALADHAAGVE